MTEVVVIPGDGIGPSVVAAAKQCIAATEADVTFHEMEMGQTAITNQGTPLPDETVDAIESAGVALKGPVKTPVGSGFRSVNVELRNRLQLYANIRPATFLPGVPSPLQRPDEIDLVVVRENLEDLYAGIEFAEGSEAGAAFQTVLADNGFDTRPDSGYSVKPISRTGAERVIRHAFEYAVEHGREAVTAVDKANIMKETDGLFMQIAEEVSRDFDIAYDHMLVDNMAQQLVLRPQEFDVIVTQNLYGDILSDLAAGLVGGLGLAPSANVGQDAAVFEPVHGTAPDIAGDGTANPVALIRSAVLLLRHIGEEAAADRLERAVAQVLANGVMTPDLGGDASTTDVAEKVVAVVEDA